VTRVTAVDPLRSWEGARGGHAKLKQQPYPAGMTFERITIDAGVMGGVPTIRGLRIPVSHRRVDGG
jgi:Protein of unknown function (DUF433)